MRFRVLGPLQVCAGGDWSTIRAAQQRVVLAILLAESGRVVGADRLVAEIWADRPPRTALNTIQGYVVRLRKLLAGAAETHLVTRGRGYQLELAGDEVDAHVFERLVESGQRDLLGGRFAAGADRLAEALALWRGPALHDVPASPTVTAEVNRLEQRRLTALESRFDAELALGRHGETVDELQHLVEEHPLRERLRCHLMQSMYRCGRRAEALEVYRRGRAVLVAELGMEPGPQLRELERAILADDVRLTTPAAGTGVVPAQLPADVAGFTGRKGLLRQLDGLTAGRGGEHAARIVTITGTPGVGKTALAVHWAHRVRDRFGDGQLYVNLRGYAASPPVRPIDALARFLHALGVPAQRVPTDVEEAAALYRSLLADRSMLVLLDNAHDPDQVRPLLPGAPGCVALVTSRETLTGLVALDGAHALTLDVLAGGEAKALLSRLLGADRVRHEAPALTELAELCARLPLALRITAANLAAYWHHTIAGYCTQLRAGNRLAALRVDGDAQAAVRAAFDLSYTALPLDARRLFRLLGLVPGADVTEDAAAALAAITPGEAGTVLALLANAHLLDQHGPGRYGYHDLLRLYARERGADEDSDEERQLAVRRLYDWYLRTVDSAATLLYPQMRRLTLPATHDSTTFADTVAAGAWLDAERPNLVAAVRHQDRMSPLSTVGLLADALRGYFWLRMYTVDWLAVATAGLSAAREIGDLKVQTGALLSLADAHYRQGRLRQAIDYSTKALATAERTGWPAGQAGALNNLGNLHNRSGQPATAADFHRRALALNRRTGRIPNQINNLGNLGWVYRHLGDLRAALDRHTEALALNRKIESRHGEAVSLGNIGTIHHDLGQPREALDHLCRALPMHHEVGDRGGEVDTRDALAAVHRDAGEHATALEHARAALTLARDASYRHGETDVLNTLGTIHHCLGQHGIAVDHHRQALGLARDGAHHYGETQALIGLAAAGGTLADAQRASELASTAGYRVLDGIARTISAAIHLDRGELDEATGHAEQALARHRETGHRLGEAKALLVLADLADHAGHHGRARTHRRSATRLLGEIGVPTNETSSRRPPTPSF